MAVDAGRGERRDLTDCLFTCLAPILCRMNLEFSGEVWFWRGPSPFYFVTVPEEECLQLQETSSSVSYGWGMIPVTASVGDTEWTTSLFPKDGRYVVPLKDAVRKAEQIDEGDAVALRLTIQI